MYIIINVNLSTTEFRISIRQGAPMQVQWTDPLYYDFESYIFLSLNLPTLSESLAELAKN